MKTSLLVVMALVMGSQAIRQQRPFKLGETVIDFDEQNDPEPAPVKQEVKANFRDLVKKDRELLKDFDHTLASAKSNSEKGELNIEMGKAQI